MIFGSIKVPRKLPIGNQNCYLPPQKWSGDIKYFCFTISHKIFYLTLPAFIGDKTRDGGGAFGRLPPASNFLSLVTRHFIQP